MRKKYKVVLYAITVMFFICLGIGTGYGLWVATKDKSTYNTTTLNCFKAYFSNGDILEMSNIDSVVNEEGQETSPYTITVTNICETTKELQFRLNVLEGSTVDTSALTITAAGNIDKPVTLYKDLDNAKINNKGILESKLIGLITVEPNETVRTNIKLWFDERKAPIIARDLIFRGQFELIDTESTIKPYFKDVLTGNKNEIEEKGNPNYYVVSTTNEGLYKTKTKDNDKTIYYYRGVANNNYVYFANSLWRIVSINDETIKLIQNASVLTTQYATFSNYKDYTGFNYIFNNQLTNAQINDQLNNWYNETIVNQGLDKYVVPGTFCNDSNHSDRDGGTYFNGYDRIFASTPSITCNDTTTDFGGKYTQKVGLITADEVIMAGGLYNAANYSYYLYNGESFYTMTPATFLYGTANIFTVNSDGSISTVPTTTPYGIRPVINIPATVTITGTGTSDNPYIIDEDE